MQLTELVGLRGRGNYATYRACWRGNYATYRAYWTQGYRGNYATYRACWRGNYATYRVPPLSIAMLRNAVCVSYMLLYRYVPSLATCYYRGDLGSRRLGDIYIDAGGLVGVDMNGQLQCSTASYMQ